MVLITAAAMALACFLNESWTIVEVRAENEAYIEASTRFIAKYRFTIKYKMKNRDDHRVA